MATTVHETNILTTIIFAVLSSSVIAALLTKLLDFYFNKASHKNNSSHDNKIIEIKNFYKSYHLFKLGVLDYHSYTMFLPLSAESTGKISSALIPLLHEFQYQSMIVKLFLDDNQYRKIVEIEQILINIKKDIDVFHIRHNNRNFADSGESITQSGLRMNEIAEQDFEIRLPELISDIELSLRNSINGRTKKVN